MRTPRTRVRLVAALLAGLVALVLPAVTNPVTATAAGTNLAIGKAITASSANQSFVPSNANDANQSSYWESTNNVFPQWLQVDLGTATAVNQIVLQLPSGWGA